MWALLAAGGLAACGNDEEPRKPKLDDESSGGTGSMPATGGVGAAASNGGSAGLGTGGLATGGEGGTPPVTAIGAPCLTDAECGLGARCFPGPGSGETTCRVACPLGDAGEQGGCRTGERCVLGAGLLEAACLLECDPSAPACPPRDWCVPNPDPAFTDGVVVPGLCNTRGTTTAGDGAPCVDGACQSGFGCYYPDYGGGGPDHCEPLCDAEAATAALAGCAEGEICRRVASTRAVCLHLCDPAVAGGCPDEEWCAPYREQGGAGAVVEGQCVRPGIVSSGEPCGPGDCAAGLLCAGVSSPYGAAAPTCGEVCELTAPDCAGALTCAATAADSTLIGSCREGCEPFATGVDAGCAAEEWCAPTNAAGAGICAAAGELAVGAACTLPRDCVTGAYCDCRFGTDVACATDGGQCESACVVGAAGAEPGACDAGTTCVPKTYAGVRQAFGICRASCDAEATAPCADIDETCVAGDFVGAAGAACLDLPTPAPATGEACGGVSLELGEPCGADTICAAPDPDLGPVCAEACRVSLGALGSTAHPDCAEPTATCVELALGLPYGLCQ